MIIEAGDQGAEGKGELQQLRLRVDRLEREVADLRALSPAHLGRDNAAPKAGYPALIAPPPPPPLFAEPVLEARPTQSLESRLGSQVFNRVAIVALLVGTAYGLKLAIDNGLLGPVARVLIGLVAGAGLVLWSERFRRQGVVAFSYSLKAVGSGVLYLSLWAAFQLFHLLPSWAALAAMILVTAWNAFMAWSQDAELLAAYALIGGFLTPVLLSTGGNHEVFIFTYVLAIDAATVALVRLKRWPRLLLGTFPATVLYFIGWYDRWYQAPALEVTALFLLLFWLTFVGASLGREPESAAGPGKPLRQALLPLGAAALVSLGLYSVVQDAGHHAWLPWVMLALSAAYLGLMRLPQEQAVTAMHLSLAIVFLTVAIPLKATGRGIVIGWLVEGAALLGLAARLRVDVAQGSRLSVNEVVRWLALAALGLGFIGVMTAPWWFVGDGPLTAFWNWRFGTGVVGAAAFGFALWVGLRNAARPETSPSWLEIAAGSSVAFNLVVVWAVVREIAAFWRMGESLQRALAISAFLMVYGAAVLGVGFWRRRAFVRWQGLVLLVFTIGKTFLFDTRSLSAGYRVMSFLGLGVLLMGVSFAYQRDWLGLAADTSRTEEPR